MFVKVLFDEKAKKGLIPGHGFSCIIDGKIMFDTGGDSDSFLENMERMMVSAKDLEGIVISHDHWDHTGGLWEILKKKKGIKVYACPSVSSTFKKCVKELGGELILVDKPVEIAENIFVTGAVKGRYKQADIAEQALVVNGDKGVSVITGCAHPGVMQMLDFIKKKMKVKNPYMVFGGFHLVDQDREPIEEVISGFEKMGVKKAGPTHCSGEKARRIFSGRYRKDFVPIKAGHIIQL